jgi:uncharacterized protein
MIDRRIDAYLVCGGKYHDFDYARLELLKLLAADDHVRVQVAQHFGDLEAIVRCDFLVTYTCDLRPSTEEQEAIGTWVERGGRWLALHGTNCILDPPTGEQGGAYSAPRTIPVWARTLGSQFVSHPPIEPYIVHRSPAAQHDPLVTGIESFEARDELYLMEHHGDLVSLLETRWTGSTRGFAEADWPDDDPRLVLYRRRLGEGEVVYFTLGHCRSHWDMIHPPHNGTRWPTIDRGSWEVPEFVEILRRGIAWAKDATPVASRRTSTEVGRPSAVGSGGVVDGQPPGA